MSRAAAATSEPLVKKEGRLSSFRNKYGFLFAKGGFDVPFFVLVMLLLTIGLIMLFSASYVYAYYNKGESYYFIKNQLAFAVVGFFLMLLFSRINYRVWKAIAPAVFALSIIMLGVVFAMPAYQGQWHRWIYLGGFSFQPSEIAKFAIVIMFGYLAERFGKKIRKFKSLIVYVILLAIVCVLMILEPHLSGTVLIALLGIIMMVIAGVKKRWLGIFLLIGAGGAAIYLFVIKGVEYMQQRLVAWLDKGYDPLGDRWQINQSLYAIGSGGFWGTGIGNSKQKFLYVSEPQNDFIFAIVGEELGFVGAMLIVLLFALLVWRGCVIAMKTTDKFGMMTAIGLVSQIGLQAALNIAVVTDTLPNTGVSLPFFSAGGTSLVMIMAQMGIVLSISRGKTSESVRMIVGNKLGNSKLDRLISKML